MPISGWVCLVYPRSAVFSLLGDGIGMAWLAGCAGLCVYSVCVWLCVCMCVPPKPRGSGGVVVQPVRTNPYRPQYYRVSLLSASAALPTEMRDRSIRTPSTSSLASPYRCRPSQCAPDWPWEIIGRKHWNMSDLQTKKRDGRIDQVVNSLARSRVQHKTYSTAQTHILLILLTIRMYQTGESPVRTIALAATITTIMYVYVHTTPHCVRVTAAPGRPGGAS